MALADLPGKCVWARSPEGKESQFGLYVYAPEPNDKTEYPQIAFAVIRHVPDGGWTPWMVERKGPRYNPRVFTYVDAIPQLVNALQEIYKSRKPGARLVDDPGTEMRRRLNQARAEDDLDSQVRKFHEFG